MGIMVFKGFLWFLVCAGGMSCVARGAPELSGHTRGRGLIVSARPDPTALVVGPVWLHVYSDTSPARVYLAPATTGTDRDCVLPADAAAAPTAQTLARNTSLTLEIPTGSVACAASSEEKPFEILWHALAPREQSSTMAARGAGPASKCCAGGGP